LELYSREEDRAGQAACLNNMALLDWDEGHLGDSERRFRESVRLAHSVKDHVGEATGLENLAELARAQFRFDESINLLLDSAESFRRAGELSDFKRVQARRAEALSSQGRHAEGIQTCVDVLDSPEFRKKQGLFQKSKRYDDGDIALSSALVGIHRRMGDFKKGQKELSRYIEMATTLRDPSRLAMGRLMESDIHEDLGDLPSAAKALEDAERILRGSGDLKGLLTVQIRRGVVEEMLGNEAKAVSYYRDAVRNADILGDREAMAHSFENLGFALGSTTKEGMKFLRKAMDLFDELNKRADFERIRRALGD
jgi:tetratricopeptide (TPR) repeat protein